MMKIQLKETILEVSIGLNPTKLEKKFQEMLALMNQNILKLVPEFENTYFAGSLRIL